MPNAPTLEERVSHIEQDVAKLKSRLDRLPAQDDSAADDAPKKSGNPWLEGAGMFRDDPLFDDWQRTIAEYRREVDADPNTPCPATSLTATRYGFINPKRNLIMNLLAGTLPFDSELPPLREVEGGAVRVGKTRISLDLVVEEYQNGMTPEDMVGAYDTLALADVYAVIAYYLRHRDEVETYMRRRAEEAEALREDRGRTTAHHEGRTAGALRCNGAK